MLVWNVTNIRISQYEIVLTPINRRLDADPSQKRLEIDLRPTVTCDGPSDSGTGICLSSSSSPCHCHPNVAPSAINSHLGCNVWTPVEVWDTPIPAAVRLLRFWVRILPEAWRFFCCKCCVFSGRGLCVQLITRPEEFYRLWCIVVWDLETSRAGKTCPAFGHSATGEKWDTLLHNCILKRSTTQCYFFEQLTVNYMQLYVINSNERVAF
jgi:hypothetical protein